MAAFGIRGGCTRCVQNLTDVIFYTPKRYVATRRKTMEKGFKPKTLLRGKQVKKVVEKPRDDVYFLNEQDPPKHSFQEAIEGLRAYAFTDENVALALLLDHKIKKIRFEAIRGTMLLPKPFKEKKILVFAEGAHATAAKSAGAEMVGGKEMIDKVEAGELEFDYCLSSLAFLPNLSHMPKILKDKMPNTRRGTATDDLAPKINEYRGGHSYKATRMGQINSEIAKLSFTDSEIKGNMQALIETILSFKPKDVEKDKFVKKIVLTSQFGPGYILQKEEILL
eukprot:gene11914-13148_t